MEKVVALILCSILTIVSIVFFIININHVTQYHDADSLWFAIIWFILGAASIAGIIKILVSGNNEV